MVGDFFYVAYGVPRVEEHDVRRDVDMSRKYINVWLSLVFSLVLFVS